jgi:hypothetical protein
VINAGWRAAIRSGTAAERPPRKPLRAAGGGAQQGAPRTGAERTWLRAPASIAPQALAGLRLDSRAGKMSYELPKGTPEAQAQRGWRSGSRGVLTVRQGVNASPKRMRLCQSGTVRSR